MIDTTRIKQHIDCRNLIEYDLGKPKSRNNTYITYKCPLHNEQKGFSLVVYEDHWHCFGKCGRGGDAIAWLQEYHNLSFKKACEHLASGELPQAVQHLPFPTQKAQPLSKPPDTSWQQAARRVSQQAMDCLWSKEGEDAWNYLERERGLTENTIIRAGLGYVAGDYREWKTIEGLSIPCGITIPWFAAGEIWGIKVRRLGGEQRYHQVSGGNIKGGLYLADEIRATVPVMITEGEFDALITHQVSNGLISSVSIGSAANRQINPRWFSKFISAPSILIRMDEDQAGEGAAAQLHHLSQAIRPVQVPQGKDVNEFHQLLGPDAVRIWIMGLVSKHVE